MTRPPVLDPGHSQRRVEVWGANPDPVVVVVTVVVVGFDVLVGAVHGSVAVQDDPGPLCPRLRLSGRLATHRGGFFEGRGGVTGVVWADRILSDICIWLM